MVEDPGLSESLSRALRLCEKADEIGRELTSLKKAIERRARRLSSGPPLESLGIRARGVVCRVAVRREAFVLHGNLARLKRLLGARLFGELVRKQTRRACSVRLLGFADSRVLGLIEVRELATRVTFGRAKGRNEKRR